MAAFRPLPWLTAAAVCALAGLIALGTWQIERRDWKHELIARIEARASADPVALPPPDSWASLDADAWDYRPVAVTGVFDHARESYIFTTLSEPAGKAGGPGYWVVTPLIVDGGGAVLVNRGFVPDDRRDPASRAEDQPEGPQQVEGLVRFAERAGLFTPPPDESARIWYSRDVGAIAASLGLADAPAFLIDAFAAAPGALPQGGETRLSFVDNHLSYALTWYGLAAALVVVYLAYHRAHGRLGRPRAG